MAINRWGRAIGQAACIVLALGVAQAEAERITIAATVNDSVISSTDVSERRELIMHASNIPDTPENVAQITPSVVKALIDEALQMQEAKRLSITISDADVNKALDEMSVSRNQPAGSIRKDVATQGLSVRSLENQIRTQLAWNKVIQRKVRRNVVISQDEVARAQQAAATSAGTNEFQLSAILIPITGPSDEAHVRVLVEEIGGRLKKGEDIDAIAASYKSRKDVGYRSAVWVPEERLPPDISLALRDTKPGEVTQPLRTGNIIQFIKLVDRRVTKPQNDTTMVTVKQITFALPDQPDKEALAKLAASEKIIAANAGGCESPALPTTPIAASAAFARTGTSSLTQSQRDLLSQLAVGQVSAPVISAGKVRMVLLCERSEKTGASGVDLDKVRQQLYSEKIELEAQKLLRNLRRDATIDIRDQ